MSRGSPPFILHLKSLKSDVSISHGHIVYLVINHTLDESCRLCVFKCYDESKHRWNSIFVRSSKRPAAAAEEILMWHSPEKGQKRVKRNGVALLLLQRISGTNGSLQARTQPPCCVTLPEKLWAKSWHDFYGCLAFDSLPLSCHENDNCLEMWPETWLRPNLSLPKV